jgi:serine/threonine protein kinase
MDMLSIQPGSRLGRYEIVEQIGRGGMATVFKALDPELGRAVAVKVLSVFDAGDLSFNERFRGEAQAIARLSHPNIVQIHDFGEDQGAPANHKTDLYAFGVIVYQMLPGPLRSGALHSARTGLG